MKRVPNPILIAASPLIAIPVIVSSLVITGSGSASTGRGAAVPLALILVSVVAAIWVVSWSLTCIMEQSEGEDTPKTQVAAWTLNSVAALSLVASVILTVIGSLVI